MRVLTSTLAASVACALTLMSASVAPAQDANFGKNKVQYRDFDWYYIQSAHFDLYFTKGDEYIADFAADAAESSYAAISKSFRYNINNRIPIVVYGSHNDFQQTNVVTEYLEEGIGGVTEMFKNRVVLPFEGDYKKFRHVIHHELVHAVINDMFYGGSIQSIITNNITLQLPLWFNEGLAEWEALRWDTNSDMFLRDATVHEYLPPIDQLNGYFAYRGGQAVWNYIATKYGDQKIGEILSRIRGTRSVDQGFRAAIGLNVEELSEKWQKAQKVLYWPDIAKRQEPSDYARKLTDHKKDGNFYNTSPALSPQGDHLAFISDRDDYFDVFLMNTIDGSIQDKLIKGQRTADFEELHLLTPGMSWSPDGKKLALAAKSGDQDAIIVLDVQSGGEDKYEFGLDGIFSVDWSPRDSTAPQNEGKLAFIGLENGHSDVYTYDLDAKQLTNLTHDVFSDADPAWSADGKSIFFSSDRGDHLDPSAVPSDFKMQDYDGNHLDLYQIDIESKRITEVTNFRNSDQTSPASAPDGKHLYFISDKNGINNIYVKDLATDSIVPLTNSLSGVYQLSLSRDGNKLAFASLTNGGFDLFLMRSPQERDLKIAELEPTEYFKRLTIRANAVDTSTVTRPDSVRIGNDVVVKMTKADSTHVGTDETKIDLRNYVFNDTFRDIGRQSDTTSTFEQATNNLDNNGNYKVNKYKLNFSPDIVYGNAGYSTFYGVVGSTIMAFSDMLGNHQIYILTNLLFDLKNSDYALAYFYLPRRIDYGIEAFHSARFVYLTEGNSSIFGNEYLYRFRNYGITGIASYPIDRFSRWEFNFSWLNISKDNLDVTDEPTQRRTVVVPSISYIHDTSLWGLIAPTNGERYNLSVMASPKLGNQSLSFVTVTGDYRTYFRLSRNYTLALRFAGGGSFGHDPQRFILGGVDNWINRTFENDRIPLDSVSDFVFLTSGIPMRGYNYSARIGTKYGLMNTELRFPLFAYLTAGPLPLFFQTLNGLFFLDVGGTWTHQRDFKAFDKDANGNVYMRDLLAGTGYGVRMVVLGFLLKMDVAWAFNLHQFSTPKYYFSVGADI